MTKYRLPSFFDDLATGIELPAGGRWSFDRVLPVSLSQFVSFSLVQNSTQDGVLDLICYETKIKHLAPGLRGVRRSPCDDQFGDPLVNGA